MFTARSMVAEYDETPAPAVFVGGVGLHARFRESAEDRTSKKMWSEDVGRCWVPTLQVRRRICVGYL